MCPVIVKEHPNETALKGASASRIEQRMLRLSVYGAIIGIVADFGYGLYIAADIIILTGMLGLLNLAGAGITLLAARLVRQPANSTFQYGYAHVEPLVHCANAIMMVIFCLYAFITAIETIRAGGHYVYARHVIWFSAVSAVACACIWTYKRAVSMSINSELLRNDSAKWVIKFALHTATVCGFVMLGQVSASTRYAWTPFVDSLLVAATALVLVWIPVGILRRNLGAILHVVSGDQALRERIDAVVTTIKAQPGVTSTHTRIMEIGRVHFIEVHILVTQAYGGQSVRDQDALRQRIWSAVARPHDEAWLTLCVTADARWIRQGGGMDDAVP